MKLYLVERTDKWDYDEYSEFVCWANSEEEARYMSPDPDFYTWKDGGWRFVYHDETWRREDPSSWVKDPKTLKVWELSRAPKEPTVILASYHAG